MYPNAALLLQSIVWGIYAALQNYIAYLIPQILTLVLCTITFFIYFCLWRKQRRIAKASTLQKAQGQKELEKTPVSAGERSWTEANSKAGVVVQLDGMCLNVTV